jgi:RNA polymerase sigma-70 factor (ECF subfamily)
MERTRTSRLRRYIETEAADLQRTLRVYLHRAGLVGRDQALDSAASELLNEVVLEALRHEERFRASAQPRAWLLGIAANLIKRKQTELARRSRREPLARDLAWETEAEMSDDDLFDWLLTLAQSSDDAVETDQTAALLALLAPDDQQVIRLAVLHDLDGESLAHALGISAGAARVRLHRALKRLRGAVGSERGSAD